jgi:hypothetical protein
MLIITLVFVKNAIFCLKLSKIAENCDHNIDPWFYIPSGQLLDVDTSKRVPLTRYRETKQLLSKLNM